MESDFRLYDVGLAHTWCLNVRSCEDVYGPVDTYLQAQHVRRTERG